MVSYYYFYFSMLFFWYVLKFDYHTYVIIIIHKLSLLGFIFVTEVKKTIR